MGIVHRHKRVTASGKTTTVRQHTRDTSGRSMGERRPAADDAAPAPRAAALPEPAPRDEAQTWWDDEDNPRPEAWMDDSELPPAGTPWEGEHDEDRPEDRAHLHPDWAKLPQRDEPEHSPAFAAMLEQNPDLGRGYDRLRQLRESGYDGPVDQDGNPTDRKALKKARKQVEREQVRNQISFCTAPTVADRDAAEAEHQALNAKLKALEDPRERRRQELARQDRKDLHRKLDRG